MRWGELGELAGLSGEVSTAASLLTKEACRGGAVNQENLWVWGLATGRWSVTATEASLQPAACGKRLHSVSFRLMTLVSLRASAGGWLRGSPNVLGPPAPSITLLSQGWTGFAVAGSSCGYLPCFSKRPPCIDLAVFA